MTVLLNFNLLTVYTALDTTKRRRQTPPKPLKMKRYSTRNDAFRCRPNIYGITIYTDSHLPKRDQSPIVIQHLRPWTESERRLLP